MTTLVRLFAVALAGLVMTSEAFCWGNAAHTYFTKKLGQRIGTGNQHEMYGAVSVDAFNLVFTNKGQILSAALHAGPDAMMAHAVGCEMRATAFGAASHSESWGCDWTAHKHGLTFGQEDGYIIAKSYVLAPQIADVFIPLLDPYLDDPELTIVATGIGLTFGHDLAETAVDLLIKRYDDPAVGARMV